MKNCPYNNTCIRFKCDRSCKVYTEFEHWSNRCNLTIKNSLFRVDKSKIIRASQLLIAAENDKSSDSNYIHIGVYSGQDSQLIGDLATYLAILKYCSGTGFYNGVYRLNFQNYLDEIKSSWDTRYDSPLLGDMKIWIQSCKCLVIYNLGLIRFGDFESQTLLSIFQERYDETKTTIVVLEGGKFCLPGRNASIFYQKLKNEISSRGVRL